jgi:toxin-antitoxin system PIN domain toxin
VKLPDVNVLVYAIDGEAHHHDSARAWLEAALSDTETIALCWTVLLAFVRVTTRAAIVAKPLSATRALDLVDGWLAQPCATVVHPTVRHAGILRSLLDEAGTAGNLTTDAHLAALAIEHGAELCSYDADFGRFAGLRWTNPSRG